MNSPQQFAFSLFDSLEHASMKTDAGVQAVFTYLVAYPRQSYKDIGSVLGFTDDEVKKYLDALGPLVESYDDFYELSPAGDAEIEKAIVGEPASASSVLSVAELARWETIKTIIMDTSSPGGKSMREAFTLYYRHDSGAKLDAEELIDVEITFKNQGYHGLSIHPPGTRPVFLFTAMLRFHSPALNEKDERLIKKALDVGLTFW